MQYNRMVSWARHKWLVALKSGQYRPVRGYLRTGGSDPKLVAFDPLGVLCEIIPQCSFQEARFPKEEDRYYCAIKRKVTDPLSGATLPTIKRDAQPVLGSYVPDTVAELTNLDPRAQYDLVNLWDAHELKTFNDVAGWIRKNL